MAQCHTYILTYILTKLSYLATVKAILVELLCLKDGNLKFPLSLLLMVLVWEPKWHLSRDPNGEEENQVVGVLISTVIQILDFYCLCSFKYGNWHLKKTLDPAQAVAPRWVKRRRHWQVPAGVGHAGQWTLNVPAPGFIAHSKDKEHEVFLLRDSWVHVMHQCKIWRELFYSLHTLNFGIGSDST